MGTNAAYFVDSGTHDASSYYLIAGYMAPIDAWAELSEVWGRSLRRWDLSWFHMTDAEGWHGEFKGMQIARRRRCIRAFAAIVGRHARLGILSGLPYPAFKSAFRAAAESSSELRRTVADPYTQAMQIALWCVR